MNLSNLRCLVIGGSIGGLTAAQQLLHAGADVHIYERATGALQDRGAGLGLDPALVGQFLIRPEESYRIYLPLVGRQIHSEAGDFAERGSFFVTSYDLLYRSLRHEIPDERYHPASTLATIEQPEGAEAVRVGFADGHSESGELLVCADGYQSVARALLLPPGVVRQATYAGYVLWRGFLEEADLAPPWRDYFFGEPRMHLFALKPFHLVVYPVPGRERNLTPGQRRLNWGWYFRAPAEQVQNQFLRDRWGHQQRYSLAPGQVSPQTLSYLQAIVQIAWPEAGRALIELTIALDRLFMQVIYEYMPAVLAVGRACLLGDAAHVASPITGSGARMAMLDSLALAASFKRFTGADTVAVAAALRHFEQQRLEPARQLVAFGRRWGSDFGYSE